MIKILLLPVFVLFLFDSGARARDCVDFSGEFVHNINHNSRKIIHLHQTGCESIGWGEGGSEYTFGVAAGGFRFHTGQFRSCRVE